MWKNTVAKSNDPIEPDPAWQSKGASHAPDPVTPAPRQEQLDIEDILGLKEKGPSLTLTDLWYLFRERWWWGAGVGLLLASAAAFFLVNQPKRYRSIARLEIKEEENLVGGGQFGADDRMLDAHVIKMMSRDFMDFLAGVIDPQKSETEELDSQGILINAEVDESSLQDLVKNSEIPKGDAFRERLSASLLAGISVDRERTQQVLTLQVVDKHPESAATIANIAGAAYTSYDLASKNVELSKKEESLKAAVGEAREALTKKQDERFELMRSAGIRLEGSLVNEVETAKSTINSMEADLAQNRDALSRIRAELDLSKLLAMREIQQNPLVEAARQKFEEDEARVTSLSESGLARLHPEMKAARKAVASSTAALRRHVDNATEDLAERVRSAEREIQAKRDEVTRLTERLTNQGKNDGALAQINGEITLRETKLAELEKNLEDVRLDRESGMSNIHIVDHARPEYVAFSPDKKLALLASLGIFGLCLFGLPITIGLLDTRLKSISEIEKFLGVDCLATVPAKKGTEADELGLAVMTGSDDSVVESFRVLYSSLRMASVNEYPLSLLVTSSAPSEGKSFVTTNLAAFFAEQGKRALIIDCDFRKPTQHRNVKEVNDQGVIRWYHSEEPVPQDPDEFGESKTLGFLALGESENLFPSESGRHVQVADGDDRVAAFRPTDPRAKGLLRCHYF